MPVTIIDARSALRSMDLAKTSREIFQFASSLAWEAQGPISPFPHLTITQGAFPQRNEIGLGRFLYESERVESPETRQLLRFAAMCVLEDISYTRKDGQYLRWDCRAQRPSYRNSAFQKNDIRDFTTAIVDKCSQISEDIYTESNPLGEFENDN